MFSENGKISKRQIRRLLIYDLFGINTLILPVLLAQNAKRDGVLCIFGAWLLIFCYLYFLDKLNRSMKAGYTAYLKKSCGAFLGTVFLILYMVYCILFGAYALFTGAGLIQTCLLKDESFFLIAFFLCLVGAYGIYQGMEGRARVYELLFWFLMVPLFLMLLFSMFQVNTDYWNPVFYESPLAVGKGIYLVIIFSGVLFLLPFLNGFAKKKSQVVPAARQAAVFHFIICLVVFLILLGTFQTDALSEQKFPIITLMSLVDLPGGFLKRQDAFMVGIWFFTLYAFMNTGLFYAGICIKHIFCGTKKFWPLFLAAVLSYFLAAAFYGNSEAKDWYFAYLWYVGTPMILVIPVIAYLLGQRRGRK